MKSLGFIAIFAVAPAASSCVPYFHRTHLTKTLSGSVTDSGNRRPVANARVTVDYGEEKTTTTTDRRGKFRAKGRYVQHWGLMIAPIKMYLLPARDVVQGSPNLNPCGVEISKAGYKTFRTRLLLGGNDDTIAKPVFLLDPDPLPIGNGANPAKGFTAFSQAKP